MPTDQRRFDFAGGKMKSAGFKLAAYDAGNLRAARIVLADRNRYERECRLLVLWAERVIARLAPEEGNKAA